MRQTVTLEIFRQAFESVRPDNFSYDGLRVLFEHCEELEANMEFDVIGLCCDFEENTPKSIAQSYDIDLTDCENDDEILETVLEYLNDETSVCGSTDDGTIVYMQF